MKAALGFDVQVPEPDAKVGWVNRGYRRPKTDGLLLARVRSAPSPVAKLRVQFLKRMEQPVQL